MAIDIEELRKLGKQMRAARRVIAKDIAAKVRAEELDAADVPDVADLFEPLRAGLVVNVGDVYQTDDGDLVEVIQGDDLVLQQDWIDGMAPSLFKVYRPPGAVTAWVQPIAPDFYPLDAVVTHNGRTWRSLHATNVWEPGAVGTEALWRLVE